MAIPTSNSKLIDGTPALIDVGTVTSNSIQTENLQFPYTRHSLITANTLLDSDSVLYPVDSSGGTITVTLASSIVSEGHYIVIKDEGGAAGLNAITVATEGSESIDGSSNISIGTDHAALILYSDGTNWFSSATGAGSSAI